MEIIFTKNKEFCLCFPDLRSVINRLNCVVSLENVVSLKNAKIQEGGFNVMSFN